MTIFLGAFLLFLVQPLLGKAILPAFGGTPAVWLTCLLFFQVLLLLGYLYAYLLHRVRSPRWQGALHLLALAAMLAWLPILPAEGFTSVASGADSGARSGNPTGLILAQLMASVGGPFLVLAATGPLLQSWFVRRFPGRSPYRLYALSNAGSLLALLGYPLLLEPALALDDQARWWAGGLLLFAVACATWAWHAGGAGAPPQPAKPDAGTAGASPDRLTVLLWLALSTCASALLLATTSQISQNVAAVPLLWVVPLALYLVTFILCFDHPRWSGRGLVAWMLALALPLTGVVLVFGHRMGIAPQIVTLCFTLLAGCMACHGELARLAPHPRHLTAFYLVIAAGGAVGGVLVTVLAPRVFDVVLEYPAALAATCVVVLLARRREALLAWAQAQARTRRTSATRRVVVAACGLLLVAALPAAASAGWRALLGHRDVVAVTRNFYGVLVVADIERQDPARRRTTMTHGTTLHGVQFTAPEKRRLATTYYGPQSGVDVALRTARQRPTGSATAEVAEAAAPRPLDVGVVGMGAGTIAAWAEAGDRVRFYEINPDVVALADRYFTFSTDALQRGAQVDVLLGDARLVLERQLAEGQPQGFDVLVVDAFSSDAIPVHLLTDECLGLYRRHLAPGGLLAFHVSNRFLDLAPVVRRLAQQHGLAALQLVSRANEQRGTAGSEWVLVLEESALQADPALAAAATPWPAAADAAPLWTDDFSSLWPVLK